MLNEERLNKIGEEFGTQIAGLISAGMIKAVTVVSVAEKSARVSLFEGDTSLRVPLSILGINGSLLTVKPSVGSTALVCNIDGNANTPYFVGFEKIDVVDVMVGGFKLHLSTDENGDRLRITVGDTSVYVADGEFIFNEGELGGLVKIKELERNLNQLKSYCETLKSAVSDGLKAVGAGTTANGLTGATKFNEKMSSKSIDFEDMENEKIKQ